MTGRVLVVDDEAAIRRLVSTVLERGGFAPVEAADARAALHAVSSESGGFSAAVLDLGLPDRDGLELVAAFAASALPTLVLSARVDTADKVSALDLGADDYLAKPFDGDELLARVRAMLRRSGRSDGGTLAYGGFHIEPAFHRAQFAGRVLDLTPREFALLATLVAGAGRVLTHGMLLEQVWGPAHVSDLDYLRVAIRAVRRKVEVDPTRPSLILNVPGIGYQIGSVDTS